jgi:hypothetical protein
MGSVGGGPRNWLRMDALFRYAKPDGHERLISTAAVLGRCPYLPSSIGAARTAPSA